MLNQAGVATLAFESHKHRLQTAKMWRDRTKLALDFVIGNGYARPMWIALERPVNLWGRHCAAADKPILFRQ